MTKEFTFYGIVQGVGFRPTAKRYAMTYGICGEVKNAGGTVTIIATHNKKEALKEFIECLISHFKINEYDEKVIEEKEYNDFLIVKSTNDNISPEITPDLATCEECEKELKNENNRRYNHPFISCINCGPRYSIIEKIPYDRENTSMKDFSMCKTCQKEYKNPSNRRCHAQTIACNDCGMKISISIDDAIKTLENNEILAIKGIGGYHLACKANEVSAIKKLRELKGREKKPFAIMFSSLDEIKNYCKVSKLEEELLSSPARPIVLLEKMNDLSYEITKGSSRIGSFLPCNPIEIMILDKVSPLIMTSANISGEPIIIDDEEIKKLGVKTLSHNRRILTPLDDSVIQINNEKVQFIRRARGYVPLAIDIGIKSKSDTLCLGGDLKATFCYHHNTKIYLSQPFGDLEDTKCLQEYKKNIARFEYLHSFKKDCIVADKHPFYFSANSFKNNQYVSHHKAHCASVIAEHKLKGDVLSFAFDGTGYGDDGAIWGSEVFKFCGKKFKRVGHLDYVKIIASNEISKNASLCLDCYLSRNELINSAIKANVNTVKTSSMGRLFDCVSALLGVSSYNDYEGYCATMLEECAKNASSFSKLNFSTNPVEILKDIENKMNKGEDKKSLALGFHELIAEIILFYAKKYNINQIALSGGVFNNKILMSLACDKLKNDGFKVYTNELVPCGDSSIALGQAYITYLERK